MKKSIRDRMLLGILSAIGGAVTILAVSFLLHSRALLTDRFIKTTDEELTQAGGTIDMFLNGIKGNVQFLSNHPLITQLPDDMTSYLTQGGTYQPKDSIEQELYDLYNLIQNSHSSYVDIFTGTAQGGFLVGSEMNLPTGYDPRTRPWYKDAISHRNETTISPVYASVTGLPVISICKAYFDENGVGGVVGVDVTLSDITESLAKMKIGDHGTIALVQGDNTIIANPIDTTLTFVKAQRDSAELFHNIRKLKPGTTMNVTIHGEPYIAYRQGVPLKNVDWELVGFIAKKEITAPLKIAASIIFGITIAILILIFFLVHRTVDRSLVKPLRTVVEFVSNISAGDFDAHITQDRDDEIGDIQHALIAMAKSLREKSELATKISSGNLTDRGTPSSERDTLGYSLLQMVDSLNSVMGGMHNMVDQVSVGSQELAQASQNLSDGATQQAAAVEEISSSIAEIESQVKMNATRAKEANTLAEESKTKAISGSQQMDDMVLSMRDISDASTEISRIMKVIDDIAFQTNLLALNAAVEAARAGQHGKGFAVVADEVRNLAQRSAKASSETAHLIQTALEKIAQGNSIASETSTSFSEIVDKISHSASLVKEIAHSATTEASAITEVVSGIDQISQVTQQSTASAEETAATSNELSHHAAQLREEIARFELADTATTTPALSYKE